MATERQIEANRNNAQHSTGPVTPEGKLASRANALKHGLAGDGVVVNDPEAAEIARRTAAWSEVLRPANEVQAFLVLQAVTESVRIERCQADERVLLRLHADRADDPDAWEEARRLEAEELGARLARDPSRTVCRLRQTLQGCDWLIDRWLGLGQVLEAGQSWDDVQRSLALDLLGVPRVLRTGITSADPGPGDGESALAPQCALVTAEVNALRKLQDHALMDRNEQDREAAQLGVVTGHSPTAQALARLRRYESACQRRLDRALRSLKDDSPAVASPAPAPAMSRPPATAAPEPEPPTVSETPQAPADVTRSPESPALEPEHPRGNRRWRKAQARRARQDAA